MTALADNKMIEQLGPGSAIPSELYLKVDGGSHIYAGALVVVNASGYAEPATAAASKIAAGVALEEVDNSAGSDGDKSVKVRRGVFKFANKGADAVDQAMLLSSCYIEDDATVRKTSASTSAAGKVISVESDGVFVQVGG